MKKQLILVLFAVLLLSFDVRSFGPWTHTAMLQELCAEPDDWPYKKLCCNNLDACMFGLLETDATVFHYVTNFKKYQLMHSWATPDKCLEYARNEGERAVCIGMALHCAQDSISHNRFVPDSVKNSKVIAEAIAHPFVESKVDDEYRAKHPNLEYDTTYYLRDENIDKYCKGPDSIINRAAGLDLSWECDALAGAVSKGGMYQSVFLVGPLMNYGYKLFIKVSALVPVPKWYPYEQDAKEFSRMVFRDEWPRQLDPTGYESLRLSNIGWYILQWIVIISLVVVLVKTLKRRSKK